MRFNMFHTIRIRSLHLIGIFTLLIVLIYIFSSAKKSPSFVEKLNDKYTFKSNKNERTYLSMQKLDHSISVNDPMGVIVKNDQSNYPKSLNSGGFFKTLTEKFFGKSALTHKIVHLDFKGAPPKMSYLLSILPLLKNLGATGLLVEYEDMFPYTKELEMISAHNAYTSFEIKDFVKVAKENNLEIIPLIQTFGHMEFVLKLKDFSHLREVPNYPQVICPTRNESVPLISKMIDQIVSSHPDIRWIHIGADEVYNIGECQICQEYILKNNMNRNNLFLNHALKIAKYIKDNYNIQPIMWDDEFRKISKETIVQSHIGKYVEIMIWQYHTGILAGIGNDIWDIYSKVFNGVWVASAFKGASKPDSFITDINERLNNNKEWMEVVDLYKSSIEFRGIALTGWQRFDHFAVLCELLPQAIPSLAVNLMYIIDGKADHDALSSVGDLLGCHSLINLDLKYLQFINTCRYPGAKIYEIVQRIYKLKNDVASLLDGAYMHGWITKYNIDNKFSSPQMIEKGLQDLSILQYEYEGLYSEIKKAFVEVFDEYTLQEWMKLNFEPEAKKLNDLYKARSNLLKIQHWPRRPLEKNL